MNNQNNKSSAALWLIFLLGISSGLPLQMTGSTLQAWMTDLQIDLKTIGLFSLAGLPFTLKFLWAPLLDRFGFSFGRRRTWMLISQLGLIASITVIACLNPSSQTKTLALFALILNFWSATQDISIDAFRRESLSDQQLGSGASLAISGYRIGMLLSGALSILLADYIPFKQVYLLLAASMSIGLICTYLSKEPPNSEADKPKTLQESILNPFLDFFSKKGALEILLFILIYKVGDQMAATLSTPFILKMGFSKTDYATIAKIYGMGATILGGFLGAYLLPRLSMIRALTWMGILQALSTLCFIFIVKYPAQKAVLASVISFENLTSGLGTAAYAAFMASLCNKRFTATQYALLSSLMGVPRVFMSAPSGYLVSLLGWTNYYILCTFAALPGLLLLIRAKKWGQ